MPSYSPVFSQRFIGYTPTDDVTTFAVPDGFTAVVREVSAYQNIGGWILTIYSQDSEAAPGLVIVQLGAEGFLNYVATEGRWMVPGGGIITASLDTLGSDVSIYVGGYLLRNTLT